MSREIERSTLVKVPLGGDACGELADEANENLLRDLVVRSVVERNLTVSIHKVRFFRMRLKPLTDS